MESNNVKHGLTVNRGRGATPEEIAAKAARKIINIDYEDVKNGYGYLHED